MRTIISAVVIIVCVTLLAVTVLSALGKATTDLIQLVAIIVTPTITSLFILAKVDKVEKHVNGRMSQLIDKLPDAEMEER